MLILSQRTRLIEEQLEGKISQRGLNQIRVTDGKITMATM